MAVQLDLRRDLPKVRKQWQAVVGALAAKSCNYTAPCVVGAMIPKNKRAFVQGGLGKTISYLIMNGIVAVPVDQRDDFARLQGAFDSGDPVHFERTLAAIEQKYLEALEPKSAWTRSDAYLNDLELARA